LIADYKDAARDEDLRAEDEIWDEATGDGLGDE
jgi:hypothetical protein